MSDLLPCPFCGSTDPEADEQKFPYEGGVKIKQFVGCLDCFTQGPTANNESDAVELWNTRTPPPVQWIKASERLPTAEDGDCFGDLWVFEKGRKTQRVVLMPWKYVATLTPPILWARTNLKKPEPPKV